MIIIDENVENYWIKLLSDKGFEILSISKDHPQITDRKVIEVAREKGGILLTEDKDFGQLVFAHGIKGLTVVFLRYDQPQYDQIENQVLETISQFYSSEENYFITIKKNSVRIRKI
jgi:predicted nuclease of predicted toxin-antitoxin system